MRHIMAAGFLAFAIVFVNAVHINTRRFLRGRGHSIPWWERGFGRQRDLLRGLATSADIPIAIRAAKFLRARRIAFGLLALAAVFFIWETGGFFWPGG